jgi:protein-tyrosine phosphatase
VFSALLLTMVGVPRSEVVADYLLSNDYVATSEQMERAAARSKTSAERAAAVYRVDERYLQLAFDTIDRAYGSFDAYRRTALEMSDADLVRLKARLLVRNEPTP